ncbi:MAG: hypothetical protein HUU20_01025 [Pirellulales bacterium]|nr:hypothetical protein [Pirellulales bacterium]
MTGNPSKPQLEPAIRSALASLRRRIRRYVWAEGLAAAVAWLGLAFWISLAIDWFFEPPPAVRGIVLAAALLVFAGVLFKLVVRRAFVRLSDRNMAMLLERRFPQFHESLLTAVELSEHRPGPSECNPLMLEHTCRLAAAPIREVRLGEVFNPRPLRQAMAGAAFLALSVAVLAIGLPGAIEIWTRRNLGFSNDLWPRRTRLAVEGFDKGLVKVARGADFDVVARADLRMPLVPKTVEIRYRAEGGSRGRATMVREGTADRSRDRFQAYTHTFRGVLAPMEFDVFGGDAAVRDLRIEVVDNPTLVEMFLDCRYPEYMQRPARTVPVSGAMRIPQGTDITIRARSNKDLVQVEVRSALDDASEPEVLQIAGRGNSRAVEYRAGPLTGDKSLLFTLLDSDGIKSREPVRLVLAALPDEPPMLAVRLQGIGPAITPQAQLPAVGRITDDYGLARTWFEYGIDDQDAHDQPIPTQEGNPTELKLQSALEVRDLKLKPGQKFLLAAKASDRYNLGDAPNVGTSERWLLEVVTPEQLRAMLEARELVLRQRFESIIEEVVETRDSLLRVDFASDGKKEPEKVGEKPPSAEPGDAPESGPPTPERLVALRTLRVQRALQNSRKDAHEVLGVAEAFDDIRQELVNNRIDTTELRIRLEQGIVGPLERIGGEMFPELERRLDELLGALSNDAQGPRKRDLAREQSDAILLAMRQVLGRMIELEDFNEAVELLRQIVNLQEKLNDQTKQRHQSRLRDLLEE